MSRRKRDLFTVDKFSCRTEHVARTKERVTKNKRLLKSVEKTVQEINGNDDETVSKLLSAFLSTSQPQVPIRPPNRSVEAEKREEDRNGSPGIVSKDQEYETIETQRPMFQNPAVEKYLDESMRKALKKYKNYG